MKIWWIQAEALVSAVTMFEPTREPHDVDVVSDMGSPDESAVRSVARGCTTSE
jgi:hypothetical protein